VRGQSEEEAPTALGLGRVGRDHYWRINGAAERFDSSKTSVSRVGARVSGSVPAILSVLARNGINTIQIAPVVQDDGLSQASVHDLINRGVGVLPIEVQRYMESQVILNADGSLREIIVENEGENAKVGLERVMVALPARRPEAFVFDTRHPEAATAVAEVMREAGVLTFADPGSLGGIAQRVQSTTLALREAVVIFAAANVLDELATGSGLSTTAYTRQFLQTNTSAVVITERHGGCTLCTRDGAFRFEPVDVARRGSSIGAGDFCRGFTLLALLQRLSGGWTATSIAEALQHAIRLGLAGAAFRIEDSATFPDPPLEAELANYLVRVRECTVGGG
jgi:sugar/nucleoside kinase (ribokinase family)